MEDKNKFPEFISPYKQIRLVMEPALPKTPFHPGTAGKAIQFENGNFTPKSQEEVDFLREHPEIGVKFFEQDQHDQVLTDVAPELLDLLKDYSPEEAKELLTKIKGGKPEEEAEEEAEEEEEVVEKPKKKKVAQKKKVSAKKVNGKKVIE